VTTFSDPLYDWPSNLAFGTSRLYGKTTMFLANFGPGWATARRS
jgi:hypothetical protein